MAWTIEYRQPVRKTIEKLDPVIRRRIKLFLEERLAKHENPRSLGGPLHGSKLGAYWRYTVGDHRICDIQDQKLVVLVVEIGHHSSVYR